LNRDLEIISISVGVFCCPQGRLTVALDDKVLGQLTSPVLAEALFAVFLGEKCDVHRLRHNMIKRLRSRDDVLRRKISTHEINAVLMPRRPPAGFVQPKSSHDPSTDPEVLAAVAELKVREAAIDAAMQDALAAAGMNADAAAAAGNVHVTNAPRPRAGD